VASGCTTPYSTVGSFTSCTPTQYQGFFDTTGAGTAPTSSPPAPGFAFARTPAQVLSILYGKLASTSGIATIIPPAAPGLPSNGVPPLSSGISSGGFFGNGFSGQINAIS
jgi:hypothetical protein